MENGIIIAIIVVLVVVGLSSAVKHFARKSGCCGSGSYKSKKKRLSNIAYTKTFKIEGMSCEHCQNRVEEIVNDINGVSGKVSLKKGELVVSYMESIDDNIFITKIERAGYKVISVS